MAATKEHQQSKAVAILKDTVITAVLAFAILGPMVGLKTEAPQGGLVLRERWGLAFSLIAIVTAGRFLLNLYWANKPEGRTRSAASAGVLRALEPLGKYIGLV